MLMNGSWIDCSLRPIMVSAWGRHWLDVVRFAESHGYETNALRPNAWPYRDYVIRAFNQDIPFARFVEDQLAGDAPDLDNDWLSRSATGFLVGGSHDIVGNQTVEGTRQQRADDLDDIITATGTTFLGLTVHCSRCHDHKFDPISQRDYYGLQAVFAGVQHAERTMPSPDAERLRREADAIQAELANLEVKLDGLEPVAEPESHSPARSPVSSIRNVEQLHPVDARFVRFTVTATNNNFEPCIDELEIWTTGSTPTNVALQKARLEASSTYPNSMIHRLEHLVNGRLGNSRSWISAEPGKGWAQVELPKAATIDRIVWGRDREGKFQDRTPTQYTIDVATEPGNWRTVASSSDRRPVGRESKPRDPESASLVAQRQELRDHLASLKLTVSTYSGSFTEPDPTHILQRGDPMRPLDAVVPSGVRSVHPAFRTARAHPGARAPYGTGAGSLNGRTRFRPE